MNPLDVNNIPLSGTHVIEASAGTGKTFNIQKIVLRLVVEKTLEIGEILTVTFTDAATAELKDRIRGELAGAARYLREGCPDKWPDDEQMPKYWLKIRSMQHDDPIGFSDERIAARLRLAILSFDESAISTIHGFCARMLSDCAYEGGILFDSELVENQDDMILEIVRDFYRSNFYGKKNALYCAVAEQLKMDIGYFANFAGKVVRPAVEMGFEISEDQFRETASRLSSAYACVLDKFDDEMIGRVPAKNVKIISHMRSISAAKKSGDVFSSIDAISALSDKKNLDREWLAAIRQFIGLAECYGTALKSHFAEYVKSELARKKSESNVQTYDDMLTRLRDAIRSGKGPFLVKSIREKFKAILIDEFQDTDPVQYEIFDSIIGETGIPAFFIGDPKQAIYGFRGADVYTYLRAREKISPEKIHDLDTNYRSQDDTVASLNKFFMEHPEGFDIFADRKIRYNPVKSAENSKGNRTRLILPAKISAPLEIIWTGDEQVPKELARKRMSRLVASKISELLNMSSSENGKSGMNAFFRRESENKDIPISPSDFAVLVMDRREAAAVKEALESLRIPAVLQRTGNIFASVDAEDMEIMLRAVSEPGRQDRINAALATCFFSLNAREIFELANTKERVAEYESIIEMFQNFRDVWERKSFMAMFAEMLNSIGVRARLLKFQDGERRITNMLHLAELLHGASIDKKLGVEGLVPWLAERRVSSGDESGNEEFEPRLERDDEAVQIMTVFKSKGLEFKIVMSPFLWSKTTRLDEGPDFMYHSDSGLVIDVGSLDFGEGGCAYVPPSAENLRKAKSEDLAELMRILYVVLTRARNKNYLFLGNVNGLRNSSLGYRFMLPLLEPGEGGGLSLDGYLSEFKNTKLRYLDDPRTFFSRIEGLAVPPISLHSRDTDPHGADIRNAPEKAEPTLAEEEKFSARINSRWRVASFSGLSKGGQGDEFDFDEPQHHAMEEDIPQKAFCVFPKGKLVGDCIHKIFQRIDFCSRKAAREEIEMETLDSYGLLSGSNMEICSQMVETVLLAPLSAGHDAPVLKNICSSSRISEMKFFYPLDDSGIRKIADAARSFASGEWLRKELPPRLENLKLSQLEGFMTGSIDLVFQYPQGSGGKFYIIDWKTNYLAPTPEMYSADVLGREMIASMYMLQYYIYSCAVHRYLALNIPDYGCDPENGYGKYFGGVFYLFLRGVNGEPGQGVYFDRPDFNIIRSTA